jgi:hypothetical protein
VTYGGWQTEMTQGRNRQGGTDLFSGNYHWSVPIVGLPGRAGHDLGMSLSYNSHVWVKTAGGVMRMIDFDEIVGNPGGGFMLGLPFLRQQLHDALQSHLAIRSERLSGTSTTRRRHDHQSRYDELRHIVSDRTREPNEHDALGCDGRKQREQVHH